jgi:hypothetical protein
MLEAYAFYFLVAGVGIALLGYFWLVVRGFRVKVLWGLGLIFFPPAALVFIKRHFRKAVGPFLVLVLAVLVFATPFALSYYERHFIPLGPHERVVDGERRITLTGLTDFDYATLQGRNDTVVLQMANPDVNDGTLEYLKGMSHLRKLDISDSRVTDQGLRTLAELPGLEELYLARTAITDEGFRKYLGPKESLLKVDFTGTAVKGKTKRDWKKAKPGQRDYVD